MNPRLLNSLKKHPELWDIFTGKKDGHTTYSRYDDPNPESLMVPHISKHLINQGYKVSYPHGKTFALCLTHDVDDIYPPLTHKALAFFYSLGSLDFRQMKSHLFWEIKGTKFSPYMNFQQIMDLERKYDAKSTFYFMATDRDPVRLRYNIEDIKGELKEIVKQGWDVGLHGGYYSYDDIGAIKREKQRLERALGREVLGYRNHYLRFKVPDTWVHLEKCGFKYDTTYGYTNVVGFRNGMCHPFKPFNPNTGKQMEIFEIPLHIMDGALFDLTGGFNHAWQITKKLIDLAADCRGVLTVLWHNSAFNCPFRVKWRRMYEKILEYGREKNAWMTSSYEIWRWWQTNGY
ncbi:MAG: polysaccharide deacetylase family protein [Clostridia bacterium]|nr:polysaccharide deacetylase family protein [Clostridia bacterium]